MLRDDINNALKLAMKAHDDRRVSVSAADGEFHAQERRPQGAPRPGQGPLSDDELKSLLQKMIKQRQESVELYEKGMPELALGARGDRDQCAYRRRMSDAEEAQAAIAAVIKDVGAASMKDIWAGDGRAEAHAGEMDFSKASGIVKGLLSK